MAGDTGRRMYAARLVRVLSSINATSGLRAVRVGGEGWRVGRVTPTGNAIGLGRPREGGARVAVRPSKPVAFRPPPSCALRARPKRRGRRRGARRAGGEAGRRGGGVRVRRFLRLWPAS